MREGAFAVVRLALPKPQIARLAPQGDAWILTVGERQDAVAQPLPVHRAVDETGRTVIGIPLTESAGVLWLDEPLGDRVAVVTAFGPARSSVKPQRFVEFSLLPTLHGLAVSAIAEDVIVRSGIDGATISRGSGLSVTVPESGAKLEGGGARPVPVVQREAWVEARLGPVLDRQRELLREAAEAAPSRRNAARIELAKSYLANGLYPEASGVLTRAAQDDPTLLGERRFLILQALRTCAWGALPRPRRTCRRPPSPRIRRGFYGAPRSTRCEGNGPLHLPAIGVRRRCSKTIPRNCRGRSGCRPRGLPSRCGTSSLRIAS